MSSPPLAMADRAETSWMAVTETPWPKATVEVSTCVQFCQGRSRPAISPGSSMFVFWPKPKFLM